MKRILLPTDFSDNAYKAILYALHVFKDMRCTFYLLHTYTPPIYQTAYILGSPGQIGLGDVMQETYQNRIEQLKSHLESEFGNANHSYVVHTAFNTLLNEVLESVESEQIDLVVMGTKGATGAMEILFGTNTVHVIKRARCPVLAIPPAFDYEAPTEILFPTDYEIAYDSEKFGSLMDIIRQHRSRINVLHVSNGYEFNDKQRENRQALEKLLGSYALFHDLPKDDFIHAINTYQTKLGINLLVMVRNKHTFVERLFLDPVIKKVGLHLTVPFMVIPQL